MAVGRKTRAAYTHTRVSTLERGSSQQHDQGIQGARICLLVMIHFPNLSYYINERLPPFQTTRRLQVRDTKRELVEMWKQSEGVNPTLVKRNPFTKKKFPF